MENQIEQELLKLEVGPRDFLILRVPRGFPEDSRFAFNNWVKQNRPELSGRILIFQNDIEIESLPLESVRHMRDRLNERIYDAERSC